MPKISDINEKPPEFLKAIYDFVAKPFGFFVIAGTNGTGKTFAAEAIHNKFWHPHSDNKFFNQVDLNMKWQEVMNEWGTQSYLLDRIVEAPLLILDDIGTRIPTPAFMDFLYAIADKRYRFRDVRGTIITTNLTTQLMREQFGDAFVSRVSSGVCVRYDGPDRRRGGF